MPSGSCMCGDIAYEYADEPAATALCHCTDCQKWTGAAYTSNVVVPRPSLHVTKGTSKGYDAVGTSGKINKHWFCPRRGGSLYTELEIMPDVTCVKSGGLDGEASDHGIGVEFCTRDRLGYCKAVEGAEQKVELG